jgi:hypothetical protein
MSYRDDEEYPFKIINIGLVFLFTVVLLTQLATVGVVKVRTSWLPVEAEVIKAAKKKGWYDEERYFRYYGEYKYIVDGKIYKSTNFDYESVRLKGKYGEESAEKSQAFFKTVEKGDVITAYYDPNDPARVVINRDFSVVMLSFGAIFFSLFVALFLFRKKMLFMKSCTDEMEAKYPVDYDGTTPLDISNKKTLSDDGDVLRINASPSTFLVFGPALMVITFLSAVIIGVSLEKDFLPASGISKIMMAAVAIYAFIVFYLGSIKRYVEIDKKHAEVRVVRKSLKGSHTRTIPFSDVLGAIATKWHTARRGRSRTVEWPSLRLNIGDEHEFKAILEEHGMLDAQQPTGFIEKFKFASKRFKTAIELTQSKALETLFIVHKERDSQPQRFNYLYPVAKRMNFLMGKEVPGVSNYAPEYQMEMDRFAAKENQN